MATGGISEEVADVAECSVCCERFNDTDRIPKSLPCLHSFCIVCLERYVKVKMERTISCPTCRKSCPVPRDGVPSLPTNFMLLKLLPHIPDGDKSQKRMKPRYCATHKAEKYTYYCEDCDIPLCGDCLISPSHGCDKSHKIKKLEEVAGRLDSRIVNIEDLLNDINLKSSKKLEELKENLVSSRNQLHKETKKKHDKAVAAAGRWLTDTDATIDMVFNDLMAQIEVEKSKINIEKVQTEMIEIASKKNEGLLEEVKNLLDTLETDMEKLKSLSLSSNKWSASIGSLTQEFTVNLGKFSPSQLNLPTMEMHCVANKSITVNYAFEVKVDYNWSVGLALDQAVVVDEKRKTLNLIKLGSEKQHIVSTKPLMQGLDTYCKKYILNDNCILLRDGDKGPTYIINKNLDIVRTIQENYGKIIGAHSIHWTVFLKDGKVFICDLEQDRVLKTLTPPSGDRWRYGLSASKHPQSDAMVIVDRHNRTMVIYDNDGSPVHTLKLEYAPRDDYAVSCSGRYIYVSSLDPCGVYIYSWGGELLKTLDKAFLKVGGNDLIQNISGNDGQLTLAIGPSGKVKVFKTHHCM